MRIQYFNGGLANQVFQYIFLRYAELSAPGKDIWFLDDSFFFFKEQHNGYELERIFGLKPNLLSQQFDQNAWNVFIDNRKKGIGTAQTMLEMGFPIEMIAEASNYKNDNPFHGKVYNIPCNEYHPEILKVPGQILYYFGYWIHKDWFHQYQDQLREELQFPPITEEQNLQYAIQIKSSLSVGVHIRRGDYLTLDWAMDAEYYRKVAQNLITTHPDLTFFVFSDDLSWCEQHADELGLSLAREVVFCSGNTHKSSYRDMQLMSMCKGLLMSNSAFCYLAALLNTNLEFIVNPVPWRQI